VAEKDDYLIDILVDLGYVTPDKVAELRPEAQSAGVGLVDLMLANKVLKPADVTQAKAAHFGAEVVHLSELTIADDVISTIPRHIARKYRVVPVFKHDSSLTVAMADPSDLDTIDSLTHLLHMDVTMQVASEPDIEAALSKYYTERGGAGAMAADPRYQKTIEELTQEHVQVGGGTDDEGAVESRGAVGARVSGTDRDGIRARRHQRRDIRGAG